MWVVALRLTPDEFGIAALTLAIGIFLVILPPMTVGDVAVRHRRHFALVAPIAARLALTVGMSTTLLIAAAAPLIAWAYDGFPTGVLIGLIWVAALRPIGDGLATIPLSYLRLGFQYRTIAITDGAIQLLATLVTVGMAFLNCGALSLVLPQIAAIFGRAICYRTVLKKAPPLQATAPLRERQSWLVSRLRWRITRDFALAASAQYAHNTLVLLPVIVLGYFASKEQTGFYAFAFALSAQANGLIAAQLGTVLQPIFERLGQVTVRQSEGFLRVVRTIGAVAVPVCLLQAALAEPLFRLVFEPKWTGAISVFSALSLMEGFYFATAPTMALLRAQGRFGTYFGWQSTQLVVSVVAYTVAGSRYGALGVAACATLLWGISLPIAMRLSLGHAGGAAWSTLKVFLAPWVTGAPVALATWGCWLLLRPWGTNGMLIALFAVGPAAMALAMIATRITQPAAYAELAPMARHLVRRIRRRA